MTSQEISSFVKDRILSNNPEQSWVWDNLLFLHLAGSRLYGTSSDSSDWDVRGVTLAPKRFWVGAHTFEQMEIQLPESGMDIVIYDFRKWLHLTVNCNPNVIETLYVTRPEHILHSREPWPSLVPRIKKLISRRTHSGFHGYATSQLKKMMTKQANKTGRREIADAFGFDTKFAMHGFRLAAQGRELLLTGEIQFPRPDAAWLRAVRDGEVYGPTEADRCIADWEEAASKLDAALERSILPAKADMGAYDDLLIEVFDRWVNGAAQP